eukprot:1091079-Amphidinium_carterae.1
MRENNIRHEVVGSLVGDVPRTDAWPRRASISLVLCFRILHDLSSSQSLSDRSSCLCFFAHHPSELVLLRPVSSLPQTCRLLARGELLHEDLVRT